MSEPHVSTARPLPPPDFEEESPEVPEREVPAIDARAVARSYKKSIVIRCTVAWLLDMVLDLP